MQLNCGMANSILMPELIIEENLEESDMGMRLGAKVSLGQNFYSLRSGLTESVRLTKDNVAM